LQFPEYRPLNTGNRIAHFAILYGRPNQGGILTSSSKKPFLALRGIRFRYPREENWTCSVDAFEVTPGEIVAVLGPNGSGKSTLLKIAAGLLRPTEGDVRLDNAPITDLSRRDIAARLGYLPQSLTPWFDYSVHEIVRFGRYPYLGLGGRFCSEDHQAVQNALTATETTALTARIFSHLSGGEKQRVLLASVLAQQPQLLLLDEPTSSLDIHHRVSFFRLLRKLTRRGIGVGVVTHDVNMASLFADRLFLLKNGAVAAQGAPVDVITQARLDTVYGPELMLQAHPQTAAPVVLPSLQADHDADAPGKT